MGKVKQKKHWLSFGELSQSKQSQAVQYNEFQENLPQDFNIEAYTPSRRDFLKLMGFSTAAAALASCDTYVNKAVSYLNRPSQEVPGIADFFATTYKKNAEVIPILAKVREGRPIKIEGNRESTFFNGATSARIQASVLDLYNTQRLKFSKKMGNEISTFAQLDEEIKSQLLALNPSEIAFVSPSISSPSSRIVIDGFLAKYKGARHVQTDTISYGAMLAANALSFGRRAIPQYKLDNADVVVSFSADFLGTWLMPTMFANQYAKKRKINREQNMMSCHIQFESMMSLTGSNADKRYVHGYAQTSALIYDLLQLLKGMPITLVKNANLQRGLRQTANELLKAKGKAVVLCGTNKTQDQLAVNEINQIIGANGTVINWGSTLSSVQAVDSDINKLIEDIHATKIKAVIFAEVNPVYYHPLGKKLRDAIKKLKLSVALRAFEDETAEACTYIVPTHHYLESWDDDEVFSSSYSFTQPTIVPIFKTRQWQDSLLAWSDSPLKYEEVIEKKWMEKLGSYAKLKEVQQVGVFTAEEGKISSVRFKEVPLDIKNFSYAEDGVGDNAMMIYQKVAIAEGDQVGNPWLQEMPDPVTKATWGNYVLLSVAKAKDLLGIDLTKERDADRYEVDVNKPVLKISCNGQEMELPALIIPGMEKNTVAVALGYGRSEKMGIAANKCGEDVSGFLTMDDENIRYGVLSGVSITKTNKTSSVAITQTHHSYEGRTEIVKETSIGEYKKDPKFFQKDKEKMIEDFASSTGNFDKEATLYGVHASNSGIHWGLSIDLNSCIGCGTCVVACNAENNVAVVGKDEVLRGHEMHWIRIDRYFGGEDINNPSVVFLPMMCQHCDNAPCENVCPVAATNHSSEGINQMAYNRCVGTRYCENNCPFKVRRFNWADYLGGDSFKDNQRQVLTETALDMNDDLTRMVLNPDVSVRSRGVMEKCSFCVQRLQSAKLAAKLEDRELGDEVETACVQACPTNAIVFGNVLDKRNRIAKERENDRTYRILEQIHVLPNVSYLGKVRNS